MSHIVIHDDSNNVTHYAEFDDLQAAASHLEDLVNRDDDANARLFSLEPVEFAVKSYVRVEIGAASSETDTPAPVAEAPTDDPAPADENLADQASADQARADQSRADQSRADDVFTDAPHDDTVEYVEASMTSADAFAVERTPPALVDDVPAGDSRRGLFGR